MRYRRFHHTHISAEGRMAQGLHKINRCACTKHVCNIYAWVPVLFDRAKSQDHADTKICI
ncbi:hypothetical protein C353_01508, partial [Cryptococcus neoformans AD1-83a]